MHVNIFLTRAVGWESYICNCRGYRLKMTHDRRVVLQFWGTGEPRLLIRSFDGPALHISDKARQDRVARARPVAETSLGDLPRLHQPGGSSAPVGSRAPDVTTLQWLSLGSAGSQDVVGSSAPGSRRSPYLGCGDGDPGPPKRPAIPPIRDPACFWKNMKGSRTQVQS